MTTNVYTLFGIRHCYIVYNDSGDFGYKRVYMSDKCSIKIANSEIEFSGDGQKFKRMYGFEASGTVEADLDDDTLDGILWPITAVSPVGGDDFAIRYPHGGDAELETNFVEVRVTVSGANKATGAPIVVRYRMLKCQFDPESPADISSQAKLGRMLSFQSYITNKDVLGASPTGMPSNGCYWFKEYVTNPSAFDPVPGDVV